MTATQIYSQTTEGKFRFTIWKLTPTESLFAWSIDELSESGDSLGSVEWDWHPTTLVNVHWSGWDMLKILIGDDLTYRAGDNPTYRADEWNEEGGE